MIQNNLNGPRTIVCESYADDRGFFTERFNQKIQHSAQISFIQDNFSFSRAKVLRGLHFQTEPAQTKMVTCTSGQIFDVAVDLRRSSPDFGKVTSVVLDAAKPTWFLIPAGFAHGFCVLSAEGAGVWYKVDQPYNPRTDACLIWDEAELAIPWPIRDPILSEKDQKGRRLGEYRNVFA